MSVFLRTSTSNHPDKQHPATPPVVGKAFRESDNQTNAEGRQTDVNFPSTTARTDPSFFYPNKESSSCFHASHGKDSSKRKPLSSSDNGRVALAEGPAQRTDTPDKIGVPTGQKMNGHYFLILRSHRRKVHNIKEHKKNESSPSKIPDGFFSSLRQEMAQEECGDATVGGMRVTTAMFTINVESSLTKEKEKKKSYVLSNNNTADNDLRLLKNKSDVKKSSKEGYKETMTALVTQQNLAAIDGGVDPALDFWKLVRKAFSKPPLERDGNEAVVVLSYR